MPVVLVEGITDRIAVEAVARRLGRELAVEGVERVIAAQGDLETFRNFQNQPAWRGRPIEAQLRRWFQASDRRASRYPPLLIEALEPGRIPRPLACVLAATL